MTTLTLSTNQRPVWLFKSDLSHGIELVSSTGFNHIGGISLMSEARSFCTPTFMP